MGTGGMRCGAGRPGWHVKAEHCKRIDVRQWQRAGNLREGYVGSWVWHRGSERTGSIGYAVASDSVTLRYAVGEVIVNDRIELDRTPCHYGGSRPWFRCGARVAVLYLHATRFACRRCQQVVYASQADDVFGRAWRRQRKLEARLGANWLRPKGMHQSTRDRLVGQIIACEETRDLALCRLTAGLMAVLVRQK